MINRFCSVPIKLLQVTITAPTIHERQNPEPTSQSVPNIKDCSIRLSRITVSTCEQDRLPVEDSQSDNNFLSEDTEETQNKIRPKRKVTENKTYAETDIDSDGSNHKTPFAKPKPKREPNLLSSPSAMRIAHE